LEYLFKNIQTGIEDVCKNSPVPDQMIVSEVQEVWKHVINVEMKRVERSRGRGRKAMSQQTEYGWQSTTLLILYIVKL
jgi:hypothetical protein